MDNIEEKIRELSDFRLALDKTSILAVTDSGGRITYVNDRFCEVSRYSREELIGQNHRIVNSGHHPRSFFVDLWKTISSGKMWEGEICNRAPGGTLYWVHTFIVPFLDAQKRPYQYVAIRQDITRRKAAEDERNRLRIAAESAAAASRAKSDLLATVSHEVRTPLTGIVFATDLLMESPLSEVQREQLGIISSATKTLVRLIGDLTDLTRVEAGKLRLEATRLNPLRLAQECIEAQRGAARAKGLTLECRVVRAPSAVLGDPGRISQILHNLLANAIRFTDHGHVFINVSEIISDRTTSTLLFEVVDSGIGISARDSSTLFEPFVQVETDAARKKGGIGLGLSICKKLVHTMGGEIGMISEPGNGTVVWFRLELPLATPASDEVSSSRAPRGPTRAHPWRILLADDSAENRLALKRMLELDHFAVTDVEDGQGVLEALNSETYDLLLLDCNMAGLDGFATTQAIRSRTVPAERDIPIVALTASAMKEDRQKCLDAGMNDYIAKPVYRNELREVLYRWLREPAAPELPTVDWTVLRELTIADSPDRDDFIREMVSLYQSQVPARILDLKAALTARDPARLQTEAHRLKSSSGYVGASRLSAICSAIEYAAQSNRFTEAQALGDRLDAECFRVLQELETRAPGMSERIASRSSNVTI